MKVIALLASAATTFTFTFTMCGAPNSPVPQGCCDPGDQLNVIVSSLEECDDMGGQPNQQPYLLICEGVDF